MINNDFYYRKLFENSVVAMAVKSYEGNIIDANKAFADILGYSVSEVLTLTNRLITPYQYHKSDQEQFLNFELTGKYGPYQKEFIHKNGNHIPVVLKGTKVNIDGVNYLWSSVEDITTIIKKEKESIELTRRLIDLMKNVKMISVLLDSSGNISFCNDFLLHLTGYENHEVINRNWFEIFLPEKIRNIILERYILSVKNNIDFSVNYENEIITKSGELKLIAWTNTILRDFDGNIIGAASMGEDITQRKKELAELNKNETKYRVLVESTIDLIWETNIEGVYTYVSPQVKEILGYTPDELINKSPFSFTYDGIANKEKALSDSIVASAKPFKAFISKFKCKNGDLVFLETSGVPIFGENDKLLGYRGISRDITKRLLSEKTVYRFKRIFDLANFGVSISNMEGFFLYVNSYFAKIHGYEPDEIIGKHWSIFHAEEQIPMVNTVIVSLIEDKQIKQVELNHRHKNGYDFPMLMDGLLLIDEKGDPEFMVATAVDITEQKIANEKIKEQIDELSRWYDATLDREDRIIELKREVNELLTEIGRNKKYTSPDLEF